MEPFRIASFLNQELPSDFVVTAKPDHPHLFAAPDLLIGGRGLLVGVFIPSKKEVRFPDELLARFTACRLGLPEHTRYVALLPTFAKGLNRLVLINFHEVLDIKQRRNLIRFIQDPNAVGNIKPVPPEIRNQARQRYQFLYLITNLRRKNRPEGRSPKELFGDLKKRFERPPPLEPYDYIDEDVTLKIRYGPRDLVEYEGSLIGVPRFPKNRSLLFSMISYCVYSLRRSYTLDMGVPYPRLLDANILIVKHIPTGKYDEDQPIRALAFAGWALSAAESPEEIPALVDRLHRSWQRHVK